MSLVAGEVGLEGSFLLGVASCWGAAAADGLVTLATNYIYRGRSKKNIIT